VTLPILTQAELGRATLARQLLLERAPFTPLEAVERLLGMQAQVPRPPFVGLWTRLARFEREDLVRLAVERKVVRATLMRVTLHLMSTEDFLRFRPVLAEMLRGALGYVKDHLPDIDVPATLAAARQLLEERPRAFDEIRPALLERGLTGHDRALGLLVRMLLPLVQLPSGARWGWVARAPFATAESWLGRPLGEGAGREELVRRYLAAFGPASVADAGAWSGMKGLRPVFEALRPQLACFRDEAGRELFDLPDAPRPGADTPAPPRFLPDFDNLVLGHDDRGRFMRREERSRIVSKNLQVAATFLLDGRVAGIWRCEVKRKVATLYLEPFVPLTGARLKALEAEALPLLRFLEEDASDHVMAVRS
jgi:hypothetical protein